MTDQSETEKMLLSKMMMAQPWGEEMVYAYTMPQLLGFLSTAAREERERFDGKTIYCEGVEVGKKMGAQLERERCAKVAEHLQTCMCGTLGGPPHPHQTQCPFAIATAIRKGADG